MGGIELGPRSQPGDQSEGDAEDEADPPGRNRAPAEGKPGRVIGVKHRRMPNGEILDANPGGHLIVENAVNHGGQDAFAFTADSIRRRFAPIISSKNWTYPTKDST